MEWENKTIAFDSMIMIYLLDGHVSYGRKTADVLSKSGRVVFSSLLIGEVLAGFYRDHEDKSIEAFFSFIRTQEKITVLPFETRTAMIFAKLRAQIPKLLPADGIHLATAMEAKADLFLTNDKKIKSLPGLNVVYLEDFI